MPILCRGAASEELRKGEKNLADSVGIRNSPKKLRTTPKLIPEISNCSLPKESNKKNKLEGDKERRFDKERTKRIKPKKAERGIKNGVYLRLKSIKTSPKETVKSSKNLLHSQADPRRSLKH